MCPRQGSNFLLLRQKKVTKEKATLVAGRPRGDCSAVLGLCGRAELASFAALTALRQAARSQFLRRALARCRKALRSSTAQKGPKSNTVVCFTNLPIYASLRLGVVTGTSVGEAKRAEWQRNRSRCAACPQHGVDRP